MDEAAAAAAGSSLVSSTLAQAGPPHPNLDPSREGWAMEDATAVAYLQQTEEAARDGVGVGDGQPKRESVEGVAVDDDDGGGGLGGTTAAATAALEAAEAAAEAVPAESVPPCILNVETDEGTAAREIFVGGLPADATEDDVRGAFTAEVTTLAAQATRDTSGDVTRLSFHGGSVTKRKHGSEDGDENDSEEIVVAPGFAVVEFATPAAARAALKTHRAGLHMRGGGDPEGATIASISRRQSCLCIGRVPRGWTAPELVTKLRDAGIATFTGLTLSLRKNEGVGEGGDEGGKGGAAVNALDVDVDGVSGGSGAGAPGAGPVGGGDRLQGGSTASRGKNGARYAFAQFPSHASAARALRRMLAPTFRLAGVVGPPPCSWAALSGGRTPKLPNEASSKDLGKVRTVFIRRMPPWWDEEELRARVERFGNVQSLEAGPKVAPRLSQSADVDASGADAADACVYSPAAPAARHTERDHFCFVRFKTREQALACVKGLDGSEEVNSEDTAWVSTVCVQLAKPPASSPLPPPAKKKSAKTAVIVVEKVPGPARTAPGTASTPSAASDPMTYLTPPSKFIHVIELLLEVGSRDLRPNRPRHLKKRGGEERKSVGSYR